MSNTATIERSESSQVQEFVAVASDNLSTEGVVKAVAVCLAIFLSMFALGIFTCKGIIYSQMVQGIQVENLLGANIAATVILSAMIMWCGKNGEVKTAAALGGLGAMICGAVAYAISCVVFAG